MFEIGTSLREARLRQGLDFPELEQTTKIRGKYLRALEDEQFEVLPSATYLKGFLRSYAECLGLDGELYVEEYNSRYVIGEEEAPFRARRDSAAHRQHRRVESRVVLLAVAGIVGAMLLVIAAWKFGGGDPGKTAIPNLGRTQAVASGIGSSRRPVAAHLRVTAARGDSRLEVREGGPTGRLLFGGTILKGETRVYVRQRLWLLVGSPSDLRFRLNGKVHHPAVRDASVALVATGKALWAPTGGT